VKKDIISLTVPDAYYSHVDVYFTMLVPFLGRENFLSLIVSHCKIDYPTIQFKTHLNSLVVK